MAKKIAECAEKFTPEIIQMRTVHAAEWLKAIKRLALLQQTTKKCLISLSHILEKILRGVFLDSQLLKDKNVLALFRDTPAPGKTYKHRIQLRISPTPKHGRHAQAG